MRRRRLLVLAMALAVLAATVVPALAHDNTYTSRVTLRSPDGVTFKGHVRSDLHACEAHRRVKLFRVEPGADTFFGEDVTDADGYYEINTGGTFVEYYTRAVRKVIDRPGHHHVCRSAKSDTIQQAL